MLNLSTRRRPFWKVTDYRRLSIYPSIDAHHLAYRCHFWMKRGRPRWIRKSTTDWGGENTSE